MTSAGASGRTLAASLVVMLVGLSSATAVSADPADPATAACRQFATVLQISSVNYNDFAYSIAGNGAHVDYQDPAVRSDNVDGRTALRQAAGAAMSAAGTPGLPPAIASPMRSWSWHAAKLAVAMGLRADGDTLNNAATELNREAEGTQMACADAGVKAVVAGPR
jgi:hypothetical protein